MTSATFLYQSVLSKLDDMFHYGAGNSCAIITLALGGLLSLAVYTYVYFIRGSKINSKGRPTNNSNNNNNKISKSSSNNNTTSTTTTAASTGVASIPKKVKKTEKKKDDENIKNNKKPSESTTTTVTTSAKKEQLKTPVKVSPEASAATVVNVKETKGKGSKLDDNNAGEWTTVVNKKDKKQQSVRSPVDIVKKVKTPSATTTRTTTTSPKKSPSIAATVTTTVVTQPEKPTKVDEHRTNIVTASATVAASSTPHVEVISSSSSLPANKPQINGQKVLNVAAVAKTTASTTVVPAANVTATAPPAAAVTATSKTVKKTPTKVNNNIKPKQQEIKITEVISSLSVVANEGAGDEVDPGWTEIRVTKKRNKVRKE